MGYAKKSRTRPVHPSIFHFYLFLIRSRWNGIFPYYFALFEGPFTPIPLFFGFSEVKFRKTRDDSRRIIHFATTATGKLIKIFNFRFSQKPSRRRLRRRGGVGTSFWALTGEKIRNRLWKSVWQRICGLSRQVIIPPHDSMPEYHYRQNQLIIISSGLPMSNVPTADFPAALWTTFY